MWAKTVCPVMNQFMIHDISHGLYGRLVRKSPSLHGRKSTSTPKFLGIFYLPHRPKFSDFFDLRLHWVSVAVVFLRDIPI